MRIRPGLAGPVLAAAAVVLLTALSVVAFGRSSTLGRRAVTASALLDVAPKRSAMTSSPIVVEAVPATVPPKTAATPSVPASAAPVPRPGPPKLTKIPKGPSIDAYRGLGSWVDIWDDAAWKDPSATVRDMKAHGVRTLYLETANSRQPYAIKTPAATATFIRAAHASGMKVVAWYLADMTDVGKDYDRIAQAIRFRTSDGQKFDSFALDIESGAVKSQSVRNANLETLSGKIRGLTGPSYPLGAIIPSPVGLSRSGGYWTNFPYEMVAKRYDVIVPMSYYTYHGDGNTAAYQDTLANMRILRAQKGCAKEPVHLIGGITEKSSPSEVKAFVRGAQETGAMGASLYSWPGMTNDQWAQLAAVNQR